MARNEPLAERDPLSRKTIALPESAWREIAAYRAANRIITDAEAVRRLIEIALRDLPK